MKSRTSQCLQQPTALDKSSRWENKLARGGPQGCHWSRWVSVKGRNATSWNAPVAGVLENPTDGTFGGHANGKLARLARWFRDQSKQSWHDTRADAVNNRPPPRPPPPPAFDDNVDGAECNLPAKRCWPAKRCCANTVSQDRRSTLHRFCAGVGVPISITSTQLESLSWSSSDCPLQAPRTLAVAL